MSTSYLARKTILSVYILITAFILMFKCLIQDTYFMWALLGILGTYLAAHVIQKKVARKYQAINNLKEWFKVIWIRIKNLFTPDFVIAVAIVTVVTYLRLTRPSNFSDLSWFSGVTFVAGLYNIGNALAK